MRRRIAAKFRMHFIGSFVKLNRISEVLMHERFFDNFIKSWKFSLVTKICKKFKQFQPGFSCIVPKILKKGPHWRAQMVEPLSFFNSHAVANYQKLEGDPLQTLQNFRKKSHTVPKKMKGGPFGNIEKFSKNHTGPKKLKGDPLLSSGFVLYVTLKRRKNYFGSVPWFKLYDLAS